MMRTARAVLLVTASWLTPAYGAPEASLKVTHRALVPVCMGGAPVKVGQRFWPIGDQPVTMTFTMNNDPRPGIENRVPGYATVTFTPVSGHKYEVEVRAAAATFSGRVWPEGEWSPVVRDRTTDEIVTGRPAWGAPACARAGRRY